MTENENVRHSEPLPTGGKAAGMRLLEDPSVGVAARISRDSRYQVPSWICLGTDIFDAYCRDNEIDQNENWRALDSEIARGEFSPFLKRTILDKLSARNLEDRLLAVRSNGGKEDSAERSFAGIFESVIGIEPSDVFVAIKKVWSSFFSERAWSYCGADGESASKQYVSVIIQEYVDADVSGVIFSRVADAFGCYGLIRVDAVFGLGEGLVSGELDCDSYDFDRINQTWVKNIAHKDFAVRRGVGGKNVTLPMERQSRDNACCDDMTLQLLVEIAYELELRMAKPVDIEFVIAAGVIYLVQVRPITTAPNIAAIESELSGNERTIWDNANIVESYSGITLPLTFSHLRYAYKEVYKQFASSMGVSQKEIRRNHAVFDNMLGLIQGRIYYNLLNWYRLVYMLPNAADSSQFMENMMGVRNSLGAHSSGFEEKIRQSYRPSRMGSLRASFVSLAQILSSKRQNRRFLKGVRSRIQSDLATDFADMSLSEHVVFYDDFCSVVLSDWRAPIVNDTRCMLLTGILRNRIKRVLREGEDVDQVFSSLVVGNYEMISSSMARDLREIVASLASGKWRGKELFRSSHLPTFEDLDGDGLVELKTALSSYIENYGFRCADELKFESLDLTDDPQPLFRSIASALASPGLRESTTPKVESIRARFSWWERKLIDTCAEAVAARENLRYVRTEAFAVARRLFRSLGQKLLNYGVTDRADDVHYLTVDEIRDYCNGICAVTNLRALVSNRRQEYEKFAKNNMPDRFVSSGAVGFYQGFADLLRSQAPAVEASQDQLRGTPCSVGRVDGEALVVRSFGEAQAVAGHILVAERTDPGWISLYAACRGLVIERGSTLSHAAVVAREMNVPTIVGVQGATQKIDNRALIRMDGSTGIIERLPTEQSKIALV